MLFCPLSFSPFFFSCLSSYITSHKGVLTADGKAFDTKATTCIEEPEATDEFDDQTGEVMVTLLTVIDWKDVLAFFNVT